MTIVPSKALPRRISIVMEFLLARFVSSIEFGSSTTTWVKVRWRFRGAGIHGIVSQ